MIKNFNSFINEDIAYHGSPFDFDYFSTNMVDEGEGASGWGYGLYFTVDVDDAKEYARKLEREKGEARLYKVKIPSREMFFNLDVRLDDQSDYVKEKLKGIPNKYKIQILLPDNFDYEEFKQDIDDNINDYIFKKDDDEYKEHLQDILDTTFMDIGNNFYDLLKEVFEDEYGASEFLHRYGIKGNIHTGWRILHYVVFNSDDVDIIRKTKPRFK